MGLVGCCLGNGTGAPLRFIRVVACQPVPRVFPVWPPFPGLQLSLVSLSSFLISSTSLTTVTDFPSSSHWTLPGFPRSEGKWGYRHMSEDARPSKEHLPCQSSTLHALWASPGHYSELVSTSLVASFHVSCGIMPTVEYCPARGFCLPNCDFQKTVAFGSGPQQ